MGAPARTWFCENGHMTESYGHHELGNDSEGQVCNVCRAKTKMEIEWPNKYSAVPVQPYKTEEIVTSNQVMIELEDGKRIIGKLVIDIPIYDVSKLFGVKHGTMPIT